jgi:hypothetical protein
MSILHKRCDTLHASLLRRIHDLESDRASEAEAWREERERLIDKILSMANPAAVREYRRIPMENMETLRSAREQATGTFKEAPRRSHFPGQQAPEPRPPVVNSPTRPHKNITDPAAFRKAVAGDATPVPSTGSITQAKE